MTKVIPETKRGGSGSFYITHRTKEKDTVRDLMANELTYVPPGTYCIMRQVRDVGADPSWDEVWMSDTPMEHNSNYDALQKAAGDVLVVGLGLGMLSLAMCHKKEVRSVTVLEIEPAVIELVAPHVHHKKLRIILADGKQPPIQGRHFDLIYVDIWPTICSDNWPEMKELLALYRRHRRTGGIVDGWMKDYVQREHNKLEGWY
jgi:methylase of polypeptide subunit release factors